MKVTERLQFENFKGFNKTINKTRLEDNELRELINMVNYQGVLQKRPGLRLAKTFTHYLQYATTPLITKIANCPPVQPIRVLNVNVDNVMANNNLGTHYPYMFFNTHFDYLTNTYAFILPKPQYTHVPDQFAAGFSDGYLNRIDPTTVASLQITSNVLITSLGYMVFSATKAGADGLYFISEVNTGGYQHWDTTLINAWTGTGVARGSGCSLIEHFGRIFICGISGQTIRFSDPGQYIISDAAAAVNVINLPSPPVEIRSIDDTKILVLCKNGIYILTTDGAPQNWSLTRLAMDYAYPDYDNAVGPSKAATVKLTNGEVFFLGTNGFYKTDGVNLQRLDLPIKPMLFETEADANINFNIALPANYAGIVNYMFMMAGAEIGLFSAERKEIILRIRGNVYVENVDAGIPDMQLQTMYRYLVYNTEMDSWSEFTFAKAWPAAPYYLSEIYTGVIPPENNNAGIIAAGLPFFLHGFQHITDQATTKVYESKSVADLPTYDETALSNTGFFCMADSVVAGNFLYFMSYGTLIDVFTDDSSIANNGNPYESKLTTKAFDFGFRGVQKKLTKQYASIYTDSAVNVPLKLRGRPDDNPGLDSPPDVSFNANVAGKDHVLPGPGYVEGYDFSIFDVAATKKWELQSLGLEFKTKIEQESTKNAGR